MTILYGAFLITRFHFDICWDDVPELLYLSADEKQAQEFLATYAKLQMAKLKVITGYRKHIRMAYKVVPLLLNEKLTNLKWNDCKDYLSHYYSKEEVEYKLTHGIKLSDDMTPLSDQTTAN